MTIHYHGTPISPRAVLATLAGKHFCVSLAAPADVRVCHDIGQGVMLDNGAFSLWRADKPTDWPRYYAWCDRWLDYPTTWAIVPDAIDGGEEENDRLLSEWPHGARGAPVWHLHEPIGRLLRLCEEWPRVAFGSSGEYVEIGRPQWEARIYLAFNEIAQRHRRLPWLHMLRGMSLSGSQFPFASVDSTDVARNHNRPQNSARQMADRWDAQQCPAKWTARPTQQEFAANANKISALSGARTLALL